MREHMDIRDCEYCGFSGEGIWKTYYENGDLKTYTCPVCLSTRTKHDSANASFISGGTSFPFKVCRWEPIVAAFGFMLAPLVAIEIFVRKDLTSVLVTLFFSASALLAYHRYSKAKEYNRLLQYRIDIFKETGQVPPLD
jgi:hypothetical protein